MKNSCGQFVAIVLLVFVVVGCPELKFTDASIVPGSVADGAFTLEATLEVRYEPTTCMPGENGEPAEEDCEPGPETTAGHGLIGVWLPEGWQVSEVRLSLLGTGEPQTLTPFGYIEKGFPDTFPYTPGRWWPFITNCEEANSGTQTHTLEINVKGPTGAEELTVGLLAEGVWSSTLNDSEEMIGLGPTAQVDARVNLTAGTVKVRKPDQPDVPVDQAASEGLEMCVPAADSPQQVEPGPRGCSCQTIGWEGHTGTRLLAALFPLLVTLI